MTFWASPPLDAALELSLRNRVQSSALQCDPFHCEGKGLPLAVEKKRLRIIDLNGSIVKGELSLTPWWSPDSFFSLKGVPRCWTVYSCCSL